MYIKGSLNIAGESAWKFSLCLRNIAYTCASEWCPSLLLPISLFWMTLTRHILYSCKQGKLAPQERIWLFSRKQEMQIQLTPLVAAAPLKISV